MSSKSSLLSSSTLKETVYPCLFISLMSKSSVFSRNFWRQSASYAFFRVTFCSRYTIPFLPPFLPPLGPLSESDEEPLDLSSSEELRLLQRGVLEFDFDEESDLSLLTSFLEGLARGESESESEEYFLAAGFGFSLLWSLSELFSS